MSDTFIPKTAYFIVNFAKHTMLLSETTADVNHAALNQSMITELFPTQKRNVRKRINNVTASSSKINIERRSLTNQVTCMPEALPENLGNENIAMDNVGEAQCSQHETNIENSLAILDSNQQDDEQHLFEINSSDEDRSMNQILPKRMVMSM